MFKDFKNRTSELRVDILNSQDRIHRAVNLFDTVMLYGIDELTALKQEFKTLYETFVAWKYIMDNLGSIENRARIYSHLIRGIPGNVCVTLHDTNEETGFMYLDLFADIPQRLNKQREELIGKSVLTVDPAIGEPRFYHIRKCIASGQTERYNYHHDWQNRRWFFSVTVIPIIGTEEIITIVEDNEPTQLDWWLERYKPITR